MTNKTCPFLYTDCLGEECEIFVLSQQDKYTGCGVNIISKNLVDVKMLLRLLVKHLIKIED